MRMPFLKDVHEIRFTFDRPNRIDAQNGSGAPGAT